LGPLNATSGVETLILPERSEALTTEPAREGAVEAAREPSAEAQIQRRHRGRRVLLVEDDPSNQAVTLELLGELGLCPDLARNGAEAIELAGETDYAVILMDLRLPRVSGLEAARTIRLLPGRARTPIVAVSASVFPCDRESACLAGMDDFIAKPIEWGLLCATLLRWLDRPGE